MFGEFVFPSVATLRFGKNGPKKTVFSQPKTAFVKLGNSGRLFRLYGSFLLCESYRPISFCR